MNNLLLSFLLASLCCGSLLAAPTAAQIPPSPALLNPTAPAVPTPALQNPGDLLPDFDGNYLASLLILRPLRASYTASPMWRDFYFEILATDESFIGNDAEAIADFDVRKPLGSQNSANEPKSLADAKAALTGYAAVDARQAILAAAADHQALFINEAHHVPMDRAFMLSLLPGLYAKGFRYFAAETFTEKDPKLQQRGYPEPYSGYYTNEPVFGDLVRTALKLGYKVVPYEHFSQSDNLVAAQTERERGEAQNIYDRILKRNPHVKLIVYAGYGHISKATYTMHFPQGPLGSKPTSGQILPMAGWFQKISKIVPFSIDQADMMERSAPKYEDPLYQAAVTDDLVQSVPTVLKNKAGRNFVYPKDPTAYDMIVFHPHVQYEFGRPTWLSMNGLRSAYVLPSDLGIPANTPALVQAFYANEPPASAIPIDQVEIKPGLNALPSLMLPEGRFYLRVVDGAGKTLHEWHVDRNAATP